MATKRKAGLAAKRIARKVYRKTIKYPKKRVVKLYSAKVGKATYNRLTGRTRKTRRTKMRYTRRPRYNRIKRRRRY